MHLLCLLLGLLSYCSLSYPLQEPHEKVMLDLPPRYMWGWSPPEWASGYCGSMSLQTIGLYFGNWITEDAARGSNGGHDAKHALLIGMGESENHALKVFRFNFTSWDDGRERRPQHTAFLKWAKDAIDAGEPVIFGVYMRLLKDPDYDHIVPMVGYDATGIYFNDLHSNSTLRYDISDFVRSRKCCSGGSEEWSYCLPSSVDYGVRVHGNADRDGILLPVRLSMDSWTEPDYSSEDAHHQKPIELKGKVVVTQLHPGVSYALLRYEDASLVPDRDFLKSSYTSREDFVAPALGKAEFRTSFKSNSTVFFRCLRVPKLPDMMLALV